MIKQTHRNWFLENSTLEELRAIVEQSQDLPGDSMVRVRTKLGANADGARITRVTVESNA